MDGRNSAAAPLALADQLPLLMIVKRGWSGCYELYKNPTCHQPSVAYQQSGNAWYVDQDEFDSCTIQLNLRQR